MTIYFIQAGENGPIKIGYTSGTPETRMAALQTGCHERLRLLGTISGDAKDEKALHDEFSKFRMNGEWFISSPELDLTVHNLIGKQSPWYFARQIRSFARIQDEWEIAFRKMRKLEDDYDVSGYNEKELKEFIKKFRHIHAGFEAAKLRFSRYRMKTGSKASGFRKNIYTGIGAQFGEMKEHSLFQFANYLSTWEASNRIS